MQLVYYLKGFSKKQTSCFTFSKPYFTKLRKWKYNFSLKLKQKTNSLFGAETFKQQF